MAAASDGRRNAGRRRRRPGARAPRPEPAADAAELAGPRPVDGRPARAFRHPLVRSAVYYGGHPAPSGGPPTGRSAGPDARVVGERRAWQLAAAAEGAPTRRRPAALEDSAERAGARGSHALQPAGARALGRAVEPGEARVRRMLLASRAASRTGEAGRAVELVDAALPLTTDPLLRADLRHQQASIAASQGLAFSEDAVLQESRSVAALDPERAARLLGLLLERRLSALDTAAAVDLAEQRVALCAAAGQEWRLRTVGASWPHASCAARRRPRSTCCPSF